MNYTTLAYTKSIIDNAESTDDTLLERAIAAASRIVDRRVTGSNQAVDYFTLADVTDEELYGQVNRQGHVVCWPHKAVVNTVSALSYRRSPRHDWTAETVLEIDGGRVDAWTDLAWRGRVRVKISYNGGLAATEAGLPDDLQELTTLLAIRLYREDKSGLSDAIGVAELGQMQYTKTWPSRFVDMLKPYRRTVPW